MPPSPPADQAEVGVGGGGGGTLSNNADTGMTVIWRNCHAYRLQTKWYNPVRLLLFCFSLSLNVQNVGECCKVQ